MTERVLSSLIYNAVPGIGAQWLAWRIKTLRAYYPDTPNRRANGAADKP
jgi:hypothetical protein